MPRVKQASKQRGHDQMVVLLCAKVLGAAGLSFSLVGGASASTVPTARFLQSQNNSPISASFLARGNGRRQSRHVPSLR